MDQKQLLEARTNPDFLQYLEQTQKEALETQNIAALYEVLDSLLILDLDQEDRINIVYENILKIAFEKVEIFLLDDKKLKLEGDELYYIRAFYEHAIEKWSYENINGAKELFFVLAHIIEDERLQDALDVHMIACAKNMNMDDFYSKKVDINAANDDEKYGYFIINFQFPIKLFIDQNSEVLKKEYDALQHLLDA